MLARKTMSAYSSMMSFNVKGGRCESCVLRARGFREAGLDPAQMNQSRARYADRKSAFGAALDPIFDRATEFVYLFAVAAGLWRAEGQVLVWILSAAGFSGGAVAFLGRSGFRPVMLC